MNVLEVSGCLKHALLLSFNNASTMSAITTFPTLFGDASTGKRKVWHVEVAERDGHGVIIVTHGYEDGKQQRNERVVTEGKNIGKKNATTPLTQAIAEAQSIWNKKKDGGYSAAGEEPAGGAGVEESSGDADAPLPMLAHDYNKRGKDIKFPCYAQRKLDGVRCVAIAGKGLFSRNGKPLSPHLEAIRAEVDRLSVGTMLDGELYSDTLTFQEIVGLVKKETLKGGDAERVAQIHLCVYDTVREGETNKQRKKWLEELFASNTFSHLRLLPSVVCNSLGDAKFFHALYVAEGYEGLILRNVGGLYKVGFRSADLQKYKEFLDAEFSIVGFKAGDGVEKGCVIWTCRTDTGLLFDCRPRGSHEERRTLFHRAVHRAEDFVGKPLSVRFQEWTDDGKPRFPVGIAIRDYE